MKRFHITLWGHPNKPTRTFLTDELPTSDICEDYPSISVMRTDVPTSIPVTIRPVLPDNEIWCIPHGKQI